MGDTEHELERQRRFYETLIAVSPTAIVTCDPGLVVTSWNPAAEQLFGYAPNEAVGRHINELVANDPAILSEAQDVDRAFREGRAVERDTRRTRRDGSLVDVAVRGAPIVMDGQMVGVYAFYEDVGDLVWQQRFAESLVEIGPAALC